jgi:hypothetical protein
MNSIEKTGETKKMKTRRKEFVAELDALKGMVSEVGTMLR